MKTIDWQALFPAPQSLTEAREVAEEFLEGKRKKLSFLQEAWAPLQRGRQKEAAEHDIARLKQEIAVISLLLNQ